MADYVIDGMGRKVHPVTKKPITQDDVPDPDPKAAKDFQKGFEDPDPLVRSFRKIKKTWSGE